MNSIRQNKVSSVILRDLSDIFQKESRSLFGGAFITVTQVRVTSDLSVAKVYISIFAKEGKEDLLKMAKSRSKEVRGILGRRVKNQLRRVPELLFFLDDSLDYAEEINNLLKE